MARSGAFSDSLYPFGRGTLPTIPAGSANFGTEPPTAKPPPNSAPGNPPPSKHPVPAPPPIRVPGGSHHPGVPVVHAPVVGRVPAVPTAPKPHVLSGLAATKKAYAIQGSGSLGATATPKPAKVSAPKPPPRLVSGPIVAV